jgi:hypothetical protein
MEAPNAVLEIDLDCRSFKLDLFHNAIVARTRLNCDRQEVLQLACSIPSRAAWRRNSRMGAV